MERVNGIAPLSRPWHGRILLLNDTRKNGVPSRTLTSNLTLRTRLLFALSYGDKVQNLVRSLPPAHTQTLRSSQISNSKYEMLPLGRSIYFAFRGLKLVRASGNAPELGTHLVRFRL